MKKTFFYFAFYAGLMSCNVDPAIKNESALKDLKFEIPEGFPQPHYNFEGNEVTKERFELGRKLFYDPILSRTNTISCGSCHQQFSAFSQIDHPVSHGVDDLLGTRNSPVLFNLAWHKEFMWDGGVNHIEVQPFAPIENPVEMDETLLNVIQKLNASNNYKKLFKEAYNVDSASTKYMALAISQFMAMMVSADSKYDKFIRNEETFSADENEGYQIFQQKCATCHKPPLFTDLSYRNNGLDDTFQDEGRKMITQNISDLGKFKVPTLRNIALSYPYMHDGRLITLDQVLEHYNSGIKQSSTLDPILQNGITLTADDKAKLKSFLNTLTDNTFTKDKRFSEF